MSGASGPPDPAAFDAHEASTFRCPSCGAPATDRDRRCGHCASVLSTTTCLSCFALNPVESAKCGRCGKTLPKEEVASLHGGACPDCKAALVAKAFGAVGYSECRRCGGFFLKPSAFDTVTHDADTRSIVRAVEPGASPRGALASVRYRRCPACQRLMNRVNYAGGSGVVIDVCQSDGYWFDRGELTAIVEFLEHGGYDRVKRRERERLSEEISSLESQRRGASGGVYLGPAAKEPNDLVWELILWVKSLLFSGK